MKPQYRVRRASRNDDGTVTIIMELRRKTKNMSSTAWGAINPKAIRPAGGDLHEKRN